MKLEISESESQRAERQVDRFYEKHGGIHYALVAHAAYPFLNLTSDLLYCLRENFVPQASWIAISDILLSPLCQEIGEDLYEMDPAVRLILGRDYWDHDDEADCKRLEELNDFATQYLDSQRNNRLSEFIGDAEKFAWCKSGLRHFNQVADELVSKLEEISKDRKYIDFFRWLKFYKIEKNIVDYEFLEKILHLSVRWNTEVGTGIVDLDAQSLSEELRSILPYSKNLSVELDGGSIIVNSNKFNYMVFKNLVESDEILGRPPQLIKIKKVLIVTSDSHLSYAINKMFNIGASLLADTNLEIKSASGFEDAISFLKDQHFDLVITSDNLSDNLEDYKDYKGLYLCDFINRNYPGTAKILISSFGMNTSQDIKNRYKLDDLFVAVSLDLRLLSQKSMSLLEGIETDITYSPKQESVAVAPKTQGSRYNSVPSLQKQKEQVVNQLELLNQKIKNFQNGYAFLIGVGYNQALPATVNDANALHDVLTDPRLAAYPKEQVQVLTEEESTKDSILSGLDTLADQVRENPEATVWIYFSGHGFLHEETHEYFLMPYEYSLQKIYTTCISSQQWSQKIKAIKAKKLMVWLDCCHAGGMQSKELDGLPFRESPPPKNIFEGLNSGSGRVVVASCKENQKSYVLPGARNSVFTTCLLEVLQGQGLTDSDDEYIRFFQIMSHLYDKVPELVKTKPQNPILLSGEGIDENFAVCYRPQQRGVIGQPSNQAPKNDIKLKFNAATNQAGDTSISLEQSMVNQLQEKLSQLSLLDQKISKLERSKITTSNPMLEFDLDQNILKLKEDRGYLNKEIEDLNEMLS